MNRLEYVLSALVWLLALAAAGTSLFAIFHFTHALPFSDQWDLTARLFSVDAFSAYLDALWRPHNEHRLVLVNLLNSVDFWLSGGDNGFNRAALACAVAASVAVFVLVLREAGAAPRGLALWAAPAALATIFNGAQSETLTWVLGLQWHLANLFFLCALLAMLAAAKAESGGRLFALAACVLASIVAGLSSGNGLVAWPTLVLLAVALRLRPTWIVAYAAVGAGFAALYLAGQTAALSALLRASPLDLLAYTARFLGNLWYWADLPIQGETFGIVLGYAVLAGAAALGALLLCRRLARPQQALAAIVLFVAGTAGLTALGRIGFGIDQAFAPRYASAGGLLWAALLAWLALQSAPAFAKHPAGMLAARATILLWALGALLAYQPRMLSTVAAWYGERELASLALIVGVRDDDLIRRVHPDPARAAMLAEELRARRKSVFAAPRAGYLGESLAALAHPDRAACAGGAETLEAVARVQDGALIDYRGHGWTGRAAKRSDTIVIADGDGRVVGLGSSVRSSPLPGETDAARRDAWTAVIRPGARAMGAFAMVGTPPTASVCELGWWTLSP